MDRRMFLGRALKAALIAPLAVFGLSKTLRREEAQELPVWDVPKRMELKYRTVDDAIIEVINRKGWTASVPEGARIISCKITM